jgi:hypothetical protein
MFSYLNGWQTRGTLVPAPLTFNMTRGNVTVLDSVQRELRIVKTFAARVIMKHNSCENSENKKHS